MRIKVKEKQTESAAKSTQCAWKVKRWTAGPQDLAQTQTQTRPVRAKWNRTQRQKCNKPAYVSPENGEM